MKRITGLKRAAVLGLAAALLLTGTPGVSLPAKAVAASSSEGVGGAAQSRDAATADMTYRQYIAQYASVPRRTAAAEIPASAFSSKEGDGLTVLPTFEGRDNVLQWKEGETDGSVTWTFQLPDISLYAVELVYYALESKNNAIELSMEINGQTPSRSAGSLSLSKMWRNQTTEKKYDKVGNEIRPGQTQVLEWQSAFFQDAEGVLNEPYVFCFKKGENTLKLTGIRTDFVLEKIVLRNLKTAEPYAVAVSDSRNGMELKNEVIELQGEDATLKSSSALAPMYDRSNANTYPSDPVLMRYNTIGSYNWSTPGQWIEWSFNVTHAGYYNIAVRARQNYQRAYPSNRRITIDGKVPFAEMMQVPFGFSPDWYIKTLGDEKPYRFYLGVGTHTIRMEVVPGDSAAITAELQECVLELNTLYRRILMVTGTQPDLFRDYALEKEIPGLREEMTAVRDRLQAAYENIQASSGIRDGDTANIDRLVVQLDGFLKDVDTIPQRLSNFSSNISSLSAWMLNLKNQPLEIDYLRIQSEDVAVPEANAGFFQTLSYMAKQFAGSFVMDYNSIGDTTAAAEALDVWIGLGRDQVQIIKELVDENFTSKTGIPVNIKLAKDSMIQATFAGRGPDIALFIAQDQPVNLAVRNAVVNLSQFPDFEEAAAEFSPESFVPYSYENGVYGMPLTGSFQMLFCRTDILEELGLKAPETWRDLYEMIPVIQQKNMNVGLPKVVIDATGAGSGTSAMFDTLLLQKGLNYFDDSRSSTNFDKPEALEAFREWTDFYTKYGLPQDFDFYNRFRTGEMPIGIAGYTLYNQLCVGAPELSGLWEMRQLPGTPREDGSLNRAAGLTGTSAVIFNKCDKENGWAFVKWFASSQTQAAYGRTIEALLGASARYDTANLEALKLLPWTKAQQKTLLGQWENVKGIPQVPASYYISRNLYNAFRNVTIYYSNAREILYKYNKEMNAEIQRKRVEFGLD